MSQLDSNNIGAVGIKHMKKANWKDLLTLYLSNASINKILIKLEMMDVSG